MIFENRLARSPIRSERRAIEMANIASEILLQATTFDGRSGQ
jgi:hypothetical protein